MNVTNNEFRVTEDVVDFMDNMKITSIEPSGRNYSLVKTSVLVNLVDELERAKQILESKGLSLGGRHSSVAKQINTLKSALEAKDEDLEMLQNQVSELQKENEELRKSRDRNVAFNNSFLNRMYAIGYLNCYYTHGQLLDKGLFTTELTLEDFRDIIDELIASKSKQV